MQTGGLQKKRPTWKYAQNSLENEYFRILGDVDFGFLKQSCMKSASCLIWIIIQELGSSNDRLTGCSLFRFDKIAESDSVLHSFFSQNNLAAACLLTFFFICLGKMHLIDLVVKYLPLVSWRHLWGWWWWCRGQTRRTGRYRWGRQLYTQAERDGGGRERGYRDLEKWKKGHQMVFSTVTQETLKKAPGIERERGTSCNKMEM